MSEPPPPYSLHPPPPPAVPISAPPQPIAQQQQAGQVVGLVNQAPNLTVGDRVRHMQDELDLPEDVVRDLLSIAGTDIVVVADDSGSMNQIADPTNTMNPKTRWEELQETLIKLAHLLLVVDHSDGFHVQFLNDPTWHEIHSKQHVETLFYGRQARGRTPLGARLRPLLSGQWHPKGHSNETELIVLVMTDGEPSDVTFDGLRQRFVNVTYVECSARSGRGVQAMLLHAAMQCRLVPQRPQIDKACQAGPTKSKQRQLLEQHYNRRADRGGAYAGVFGAFLGLWAFRRARSARARSAGVLWKVSGAAAPLESGTARFVAMRSGSKRTGAGRDTTGAPLACWSACATLG